MDVDSLRGIHVITEVLGLDHVRREEKIQGIANSRNVFESILFRTVRALVVHHIRWWKRNYRGRGIRDCSRKLFHRRRLVQTELALRTTKTKIQIIPFAGGRRERDVGRVIGGRRGLQGKGPLMTLAVVVDARYIVDCLQESAGVMRVAGFCTTISSQAYRCKHLTKYPV